MAYHIDSMDIVENTGEEGCIMWYLIGWLISYCIGRYVIYRVFRDGKTSWRDLDENDCQGLLIIWPIWIMLEIMFEVVKYSEQPHAYRLIKINLKFDSMLILFDTLVDRVFDALKYMFRTRKQ